MLNPVGPYDLFIFATLRRFFSRPSGRRFFQRGGARTDPIVSFGGSNAAII
jgi:hypothetical protein